MFTEGLINFNLISHDALLQDYYPEPNHNKRIRFTTNQCTFRPNNVS